MTSTTPTPAPSGQHMIWRAVLLFISFGLLWWHAWHFNHVADDAFISFQYARNLAAGHGLVWAPGQYVMGYSNLLWVLLLAVAEALGISSPVAARFLGFGFSCGMLYLLERAWERRYQGAWLPKLAGLGVVLSSGTFALWVFGGLEGPLFAFLMIWLVTQIDHPDVSSKSSHMVKLGLLMGAVALTRPEGIAYTIPMALYLLYRPERPQPWSRVALFVGIAVGIYAVFSIWKYSYYGDVLPNTYYAKTQPLSAALLWRGWLYTRGFFEAYLYAPLVILALWAWSVQQARKAASTQPQQSGKKPQAPAPSDPAQTEPPQATARETDEAEQDLASDIAAPNWLPGLLIVGFVAFFLRIGGDALVYHRLWVMTIPMFALLAAEVTDRLQRRGDGYGLAFAVVVILALPALQLPNSLTGQALRYLRKDEAQMQQLRSIARQLSGRPQIKEIAANIVGILAYYSDKPILDMLGLNNRHIAKANRGKRPLGIPAHECYDGAYVLAQKPSLIVHGFPRTWRRPMHPQRLTAMGYPSDRSLLRQPGLFHSYAYVSFQLENRRFLSLLVRRGAPLKSLCPTSQRRCMIWNPRPPSTTKGRQP